MSTSDRTRDPLGLGPLPTAADQEAAHLEYAQLRAENERLRKALAFAASVIKSGEGWSKTCEDVIGGALGHAS